MELTSFDVAGGEFIKYLNDDAVLMPDCVARLVDAFRLAPDIALATSYRRRIDARGDFLPDQAATRPLVDRDVTIDGVTTGRGFVITTPYDIVSSRVPHAEIARPVF